MTLYNLAESLILEVTSKPDIMGIMGGKRIAELYYDDNEDPGGKEKRFVEIYCYGISKAGNDVVRVYQVGGDTKTIQPGWKLFRVDRMNNLRKLGGTFSEPRPLFNPNGDKDMIKIYNIINFNKQL
ncbi:MAG: hypothetical protein ACW980_23630 [Promethearchaeota archaeon]|jgi:hypothetical protein